MVFALLTLATVVHAQETAPLEPGAQFEVEVLVTERFEQHTAGHPPPSIYEDVHRLVAVDRVEEVGPAGVPTRVTRHVLEQTSSRASQHLTGHPERSIVVGRRLTLSVDADGEPFARRAAWSDDEPADDDDVLLRWQLVPEDPRLWRGAPRGDVTDASARSARPRIVARHLDRLPARDDRGGWRIEVKSDGGWITTRLIVESERDPRPNSPSKFVSRLEVVTRLRRSEGELPVAPLPPPVTCDRCEGAGEVWCERCGPPGEGAKPACGIEAHSVLRRVRCPSCEGRRKR